MSNHKTRITKLESLQPPAVVPVQRVSLDMWNRSMEALAEALETSRATVEAALRSLSNEQP